jgi:hypothetical protein
MKTKVAAMLMATVEDRHAPANFVRYAPEKEGRCHRGSEIDGIDQRERELREVELVTVNDVERRRQSGADEHQHQLGGSAESRRLAL